MRSRRGAHRRETANSYIEEENWLEKEITDFRECDPLQSRSASKLNMTE